MIFLNFILVSWAVCTNSALFQLKLLLVLYQGLTGVRLGKWKVRILSETVAILSFRTANLIPETKRRNWLM